MKNLRQWIRAVWLWLYELRHLWLALLITAISLIVSLQHGASEKAIRLTGLVLQLLGVGTVILGIRETRSLFGHPSGWSIFRAWLIRFPSFNPKPNVASASLVLPCLESSSGGYSIASAGDVPTLESRIAALETNIHYVNARINNIQETTTSSFRNLSTSLKQEESNRTTADQKINEKLEAAETGGVHISAVGSLWLFVGVTLSTASVEIANLVK